MKKLIIAAMIAMMPVLKASSQDVYNELIRSAAATAEDESNNLEVRKIATFKYDALNYIGNKVRVEVVKRQDDTAYFDEAIKLLNGQALALHEFIDRFTREWQNARAKDREAVIKKWSDAAVSCPLYQDSNTDYTLAYYNNMNYITRFPLNTDWVTALEKVDAR